MVVARVREAPADSAGNVLFSKEGIVAILEAALAAEERLMDLEGPTPPDYGR
jgi:hypothetical protein